MQVVEQGSDWLLVEWQQHFIGYWTGAVNHHGMRATSIHLSNMAQKHPSKRCGYLCVLLDGFHLPNAESRAEMVRIAPKISGKLHGFGVVIGGVGFKSAALRGFITSVALLARLEFPVPTFHDAAAADEWFRKRVTAAGDDWGPAGSLVETDAAIRAKYFPST